MHKLLLIITLLLSNAANARIWYQDNNLHKAGGVPKDFATRTISNESLNNMAVYYLRIGSARANPNVMRRLAINLKGKPVALDVDDATWANCRNKRNYSKTIKDIKLLQSTGLNIRYIGLQSVLSKPYKKRDNRCNEYRTIEQSKIIPRYLDILSFYQQVQPVFPSVSIGIIDALPAKRVPYWKDAYRDITIGLRQRKFNLGFIQLDMPEHLITSPEPIRYIKSLGVTAGLYLVSSKAGVVSGFEVERKKVKALLRVKSWGANYYISSGWFKYPEYSGNGEKRGTSLGTLNILNMLYK